LVVFRALGCQALLGVTFGVAVRIAQVFWACFGLLSYARYAANNPTPGLKQPRWMIGNAWLGRN
jgi:hypothetical protein